ncbi:MAG: ATP-binding cassette domain-containing protein [Bifidobacteriaceae bacterium]|jgi:simple sugar transport system ATP-binding protein|nr:ATP-binding cassette domain-containing protein [Bifidobacteriaceae bacterium]MCI1979297.1 ATP-binding cassette domain-containing protein [Bifidobacteriaceae bacterium]
MTVNKRYPLMKMNNVSVTFGFLEALKHIDLSFYPGEILALVGDNGAGKSTVLKVLAGLYQPDEPCSVEHHGVPTQINGIHDSRELGIAAVFQDQEFCDNLDVTANLFLGHEMKDELHRIDIRRMEDEARRVLAQVSSPIGLRKPISTLSKGQSQMLAIARTLLDDPDMILLDEPTASLSVTQTAEVLTYIKKLRSAGKSIVFICNTLPDVFAIADRIVVLRHGRINGEHLTSETSYEQIIAEIAGVDSGEFGNESGFLSTKSRLNDQRKLIDRDDSPATESGPAEMHFSASDDAL